MDGDLSSLSGSRQELEGGILTYRGQPAGSGARVLRALIVLTIALVAYWASTGGLDQIPVADNSTISSSSQSE